MHLFYVMNWSSNTFATKLTQKHFMLAVEKKQRKIIVLQIRKSEKQIYFSIFLIKHLKNILYQQKGITNM